MAESKSKPSAGWPETEKVLAANESITMAVKPKLTRSLLLDFVKNPSENKPRELTAMTRQQESDIKALSLGLKFREQEIKLQKLGAIGGDTNIRPVREYLGIA